MVTGNATYGTPLDIKTGKEVHSIMFEYITRDNGSTNPNDITLWASNDDEVVTNKDSESWFKLGPVLNTPAAGKGKEKYTSKVYISAEPFKYLRIAVKTGNLPVDGTGAASGCWGMSKLTIWGY